jgi:hypothetical protein
MCKRTPCLFDNSIIAAEKGQALLETEGPQNINKEAPPPEVFAQTPCRSARFDRTNQKKELYRGAPFGL